MLSPKLCYPVRPCHLPPPEGGGLPSLDAPGARDDFQASGQGDLMSSRRALPRLPRMKEEALNPSALLWTHPSGGNRTKVLPGSPVLCTRTRGLASTKPFDLPRESLPSVLACATMDAHGLSNHARLTADVPTASAFPCRLEATAPGGRSWSSAQSEPPDFNVRGCEAALPSPWLHGPTPWLLRHGRSDREAIVLDVKPPPARTRGCAGAGSRSG
jgi:hypothetical protein